VRHFNFGIERTTQIDARRKDSRSTDFFGSIYSDIGLEIW
jgi:hypothetical protein